MRRLGAAAAVFALLLAPTTVRAQSPAELIASGHVRIRAWAEPSSVLVGQRAVLRVQVLTRTWFLEAPAFPPTLEIDDAVVLRSEGFAVNTSERIDGQRYAGQTRTYAVFPVAPGPVVIPPLEVTLVVARDDASRSEPVALTTAPMEVTATLPEAARGHGLIIAAPALEVTESWSGDLQRPRVGDAIGRTITQSVTDSVAMVLPRPELGAPEGVALYLARPEIETSQARGELLGRRVDSATYVLEAEGPAELPEVVLVWWDLGGQTLRREVLPCRTLEVAPNPELDDDHLTAPEGEAAPANEPTVAAIDWRRLTILGGLAVALIAVAVRTRRWLRDRPPRPGGHGTENEKLAWERLRGTARGGEAAPTFAALLAWLDTVRPGLGWRAALVDAPARARAIVEELESAVYGGEERTPQGTELVRHLGPARRHLRAAAARRRGAGPDLPDLNPGPGRAA